MKRNTSNWNNFCMLLRRAGLTASAGLSCLKQINAFISDLKRFSRGKTDNFKLNQEETRLRPRSCKVKVMNVQTQGLTTPYICVIAISRTVL